jgi:hypothetical protein
MSWFNPPAANIQLPSYVSPALYGLAIPGQTTQAPTGSIDPNAVGGQYYSGTQGLGGYNTFGQLLPQAMNIGQGMVNDPSAFQYLNAAYGGAGLGTAGALNAYGAGANLYGLGGPTIATAFDPQNALYNRTLGQTQEQTLANLTNAGLATSPFGQSVLGNTLGNFNIDWQNAQQARQLAGINALTQMYPQAANMQQGAVPWYTQAGGLPWTTGQQIGGANLGTLSSLGGFGTSAANIPQMQLQDYYNLMGWGTGAQQQAFTQAQMAGVTDPMAIANAQNDFNQRNFQNALAQAQAASSEQASMFGGLGRLAGAGVGSFFGPAGMMMGASIGGGTPLMGGGGGGGGGGNIFSGLPGGGWNWGFASPQQTSSIFPQAQYGGEVFGPTVVGEEGPEVVTFNQPGMVTPNPQTQMRMGGGLSRGETPFMPGMPAGQGAGQPYPMPMPGAGMGGIAALGRGMGRPGMGWNLGGGFGG